MLWKNALHLDGCGMGVSQGGTGLQERPGQVQVAEGSSAKPGPIRRLRIEGRPLPRTFLRGCCATRCCLHVDVYSW